jgi:hypothetical protein
MMRYAFNCLQGVGLGQILPHIQYNGEIGREDLLAVIQLLQAARGDSDRVATTERTMWEIKHMYYKVSQYYTEFRVIATDLDWNPSTLRNSLQVRLPQEINDWYTYCDMP